MAKGLRSKSKRKFRTLKRDEVFKPVEDARLERLAQKQAEAAGAVEMKVDEEESADPSIAEPQPEHILVDASKRGRSRAKQMDIDGDEEVVAAAAASIITKSKDLRDAIEKDSLYLSRRKFKRKMEQRKKSAVRAKSVTRKKSSKR